MKFVVLCSMWQWIQKIMLLEFLRHNTDKRKIHLHFDKTGKVYIDRFLQIGVTVAYVLKIFWL